jgi:hypothetical protein
MRKPKGIQTIMKSTHCAHKLAPFLLCWALILNVAVAWGMCDLWYSDPIPFVAANHVQKTKTRICFMSDGWLSRGRNARSCQFQSDWESVAGTIKHDAFSAAPAYTTPAAIPEPITPTNIEFRWIANLPRLLRQPAKTRSRAFPCSMPEAGRFFRNGAVRSDGTLPGNFG